MGMKITKKRYHIACDGPVDAMAYAMCCENKLLRLSPDKIEEIRSLIKKMGEKLKPKTPKPDFVEPVIEKRTCGNCGFLRDRVGGINTFKCFCKAENTNIHFKGCGLWKPKERTCETCVLFLGKHPIVANFYHCVEVPLFASLCPCEEWTPKPLVLERRNVPTRCGNCGFRLGPRSARVVVEKLPKEENVVVAGDSDSGYVIIGSPKMFNEDLFFIDRRVFSHNYLCAAALDSGVMEVE